MKRRVVAYVAVAYLLAAAVPLVANAATAATSKSLWGSKSGHHATKAMSTRIDLNTASESDIAALPGLDEATAQKIVAARPFKNSSQVLSKGIVTKEEFAKIRNRITARPTTMAKNTSHPGDTNASGSKEGLTK